MKRKLTTFIAITIVIAFCKVAYAVDNNFCKNLDRNNENIAYLLDKNNKLSREPIDYGTWTDDGVSNVVLIPTQYKLVIYPENLKLINNGCIDYGCLRLKKIKSLCKGMATYSVEFTIALRRKQKYYHYKDKGEIMPIFVESPRDEHFDEELDYQFKPSYVGKVVSHAKNK